KSQPCTFTELCRIKYDEECVRFSIWNTDMSQMRSECQKVNFKNVTIEMFPMETPTWRSIANHSFAYIVTNEVERLALHRYDLPNGGTFDLEKGLTELTNDALKNIEFDALIELATNVCEFFKIDWSKIESDEMDGHFQLLNSDEHLWKR
ncbi:unnamed protein product, partial [Owenia fusiformis]